MRDSEILQAKIAVWILSGMDDRGEEGTWFRASNPAQEMDSEDGGKQTRDRVADQSDAFTRPSS